MPCGRFGDRMIFPVRNGVRQLAFRKDVTRDVLVVRRIVAKPRNAVMGVEYDNRLSEFLSHNVDWPDEVGVSTDKDENVGVVSERIEQHRRGEVDIRAFLFQLHNTNHSVLGRVARLAGLLVDGKPCGVLAVETLDDFNLWECRKGLKVDFLPVKCGGIVRIGLDWRCEIFQRLDFVIVTEKVFHKENGINPFPGRAFDSAVVEIISVEINVCSFHLVAFKLQGPQPMAEAPHRLVRGWRLDGDIIAKIRLYPQWGIFHCKEAA